MSSPVNPVTRSRAKLHLRTLAVLIIAQIFGGLGLAAGVTVGSLLAAQILGNSALAGVPTALFTAGSAGSAWLVGRICNSSGRRRGLSLGYLAGAIGGAGVVLGAVLGSIPLLLGSLVVYGSGTATNLQSRYAGADLAPVHRRGLSMSAVLFATTVGAVAGPNLGPQMGSFAASLGWPALTGPFALAAVAYLAAALVLWLGLQPDPLVQARQWAASDRAEPTTDPEPEKVDPKPVQSLRVAGLAMVVTQLVMVGIMTMTPIHLIAHGHGLSAVGIVIAFHIAGMYLPSPLTGWLSDRYGRKPIILTGGAFLLMAAALCAVTSGDSVPILILALVFLGLGWNFGLIGGSALVADATTATNRGRIQGSLDVAIALSGATAGLASGAIMAATSYHWLAVVGGLMAVILVLAITRAE